MLSPAWAELTSPCLSGTWTEYVSATLQNASWGYAKGKGDTLWLRVVGWFSHKSTCPCRDSHCESLADTIQDWAPAIAMIAVYGIFFAEVAAYRLGTKRLERLGVAYSE